MKKSQLQGSAMSAKSGTGLRKTIQSVLAAAFGVQSKARLKQDFSQGRPMDFIVAGLLATVLFILALIALVNLVV